MASEGLLAGQRCNIGLVSWSSFKLRRVSRSSLAAETQALADAEDELHYCRVLWLELTGTHVKLERSDEAVQALPAVLCIDARAIYDVLVNRRTTVSMVEKRTALELTGFMQKQQATGLQVRWVHGEANLADAMTKSGADLVLQRFFDAGQQWAIVFDTALSAKKRKQAGLAPLDATADFLECLVAFLADWVP